MNVTDLRREDDLLKSRERDKIISEARLLRRNAAVVAWAIRTHLDYVSTFSFQCRSGNPQVDDRVEELMSWWSRPLNCDVTARHSLQKLVRLAEGCATTDGDCLISKISTGKLQLIEADRVRTPTDFGDLRNQYKPNDFANYINGIEVTDAGTHLNYAICDRKANGFVLRSVVPARFAFHHAYLDRYDQVRGVSPLAAAINQFCDLHEAQEYALAKMKLSQLFGLKFRRAADVASDEEPEPYSFDFGGGPQAIDLDPGDDAEFMESGTPSDQFQAFMLTGIQIGLKSLDIPYSFFSENFTNYSGARQALLQYEQSAEGKRQNVQQLLNSITAWRIAIFIEDGELLLPAGWTLENLKWEWIPKGLPWIDPVKESKGDEMAINNRLKSRQQIAKERGQDWFTICDQLAEEEAYMKERGIVASNSPNGETSNANDEDDKE